MASIEQLVRPVTSHALVTGATGYVGSRLVAALAHRGMGVTATARNTENLKKFGFPPQVGIAELDVSDAGSCTAAFASAAHDAASGSGASSGPPNVTAFFLVHSIGEGDFAKQDLNSARQFAAAAREQGITRIVYLGGLIPQDDELSEHLESRAEVGDALGDAGVDLVSLRAAIILGAGSTSFELVRHIADRVPVIPIPTWMNHPVSPIAVDDVLRYLVAAAQGTLPPGSYDLSNDDRPTYAELIKAYAADRRLHRIWVPFPPVPPRLVAIVASWLTPLPHDLTADLVMSLPNSMDSFDRRVRDLVPDPDDGLTTVAQALRRIREQHGQPGSVYASSDPLFLADTDPGWAGPR